MTCPTCKNAHSDECSVAALKARIESLDRRVGILNTRERMVLDELGYAEDVSPVWNAVLGNIRKLRNQEMPPHLLLAMLQAQRAFEQRDRGAFGTINENVQPVADAALVWIREVERERDTLRAQIADHQRLHDLVRHQRGPLHDAELINDAEYAALSGDPGAVARLEGYDELRLKLAEAEITLLNERGEGAPPGEGWTWYASGQVREWRRGGERVIPAHPGQWEAHAPGEKRITRKTARDAMKAANERLAKATP